LHVALGVAETSKAADPKEGVHNAIHCCGKCSRLLGRGSDEKTTERLGLAFHYGLAVGWAPTYALLRRRTTLRPLAAGLASGTAMWLLADEGITPALGFSAPNRAYPLSTHVRAFAFGAAVAAVTETAWRLLGRNPI
jgi:hypothetical protein